MEIVEAKYKTGRYIGKLLEVQEQENRALFQVMAVRVHPNQGDLHNPKKIDVPYFHQRKALAYLEKTWVPYTTVKSFNGEVEAYQTSLKKAWASAMERLQQDESEWAQKSRVLLEDLKEEYRF